MQAAHSVESRCRWQQLGSSELLTSESTSDSLFEGFKVFRKYIFQEDQMAKNTGGAGRKGAVTNRMQYEDKDGAWVKLDGDGHAIAIKQTQGAWKGVRKTVRPEHDDEA
jgi:hypothetical protein